MATHQKLTGKPRDVLGKQVAKLRRQGLLPAIIYGPVVATPEPITVDEHEFSLLYREIGTTSLVDLAVDGTTHTVFIREVQRDPVGKHTLHVEFYAPNLTRPIEATVPVVAVGELASDVDGVLTQSRQDVVVRALPENIPHQIEVDVSGLDTVNSAIFVSDLSVPPDVEIVTSGDEVVFTVSTVAAPEEVLEPEAEEALAEETGDQPSEIFEGAEPVEEE